MNPRERAISGLWGAVIGDALGVPVEFQSRPQLDANPVVGMRGMGSHKQPAGTWSDDTSMMLCIVESLCGDKFDTEDIGARFVRWYRKAEWTAWGKVFDIGLTTAEALTRLAAGGIPAEKIGATDEFANGNGALMRTLPLALAFSRLPLDEFASRIERVASITHGHAISRMSCVYYCLLARRVMGGQSLEEAFHAVNQEFIQHYSRRPESAFLLKFQRLTDGVLSDYPRDLIDSGGYTLATLEASIWCTLRAPSYEVAVLEAINLGNDTDTTGMVTGGLAGMVFGIGTPEVRNWAKEIARRKEIQTLFTRFIDKILQTELRDTLYEKMSINQDKLRPESGGPSISLPPHSLAKNMNLKAVRGNIVTQQVDAIVNAANTSLLGGGGVDGAIHRAAGPQLVHECRALNGCRTGDAKITAGYNLVAKHIIHTVGPVWNNGKSGEADKLRSCYQRCMEVAELNGIRTMAFPAISTGIYSYPHDAAARIAISTVQAYALQNPRSCVEEVTFVCFDADQFNLYEAILAASPGAGGNGQS